MKLEQLRASLVEAQTQLRAAAEAIENADDAADLDALDSDLETASGEVERINKNIERLERTASVLKDTPEAVVTRHATAKGELRSEPVYRQDKGGFFADLLQAHTGDGRAQERLQSNNREQIELRAGLNQTATTGGEFIPPVWLEDYYAPKLRAGRPFLNALGTKPFMGGTNSINLPAITTGGTAAAQADAGAVSNTDFVTATKTAQIQTVAGRQVASYQLIDLSFPGVDAVIADDCARAYTAQLDNLALNGSVTNAKGLLNVSGVNAVTYTDASPTVAELYPFIFQAKSSIEKTVFTGVDFAVMHPSTWNFYLSALDTANRPLALSTDAAAFNALAGFEANTGQGLAGNMVGIPVIVDANMPVNLGGGTNQAPIALMNRVGLDVWEGVPVFKVADQTNIANLQYQFVLYGYYGVMSRQPGAISVINGTGLIVQTGF